MVQPLDLLGCIAVGATKDEALAATPEAIRVFPRFLRRHGSTVEPEALVEIRVVEHVSEGAAVGNAYGFLHLHSMAQRGEIEIGEGLRPSAARAVDRVALAGPAQWNSVREISGRTYTARKALRQMLEHNWEHLAQRFRLPNGPPL